MKESKFVKTKIAAGYVVLVVVCILSVGYVYRSAVRFSAPDGSYARLQARRNLVNQTLYHLYRAESFGQLMIAGYQSYEDRYRQELRRVGACIDSLGTFSGEQESLQRMRLDSIVRLLSDKERRTKELRRTIRDGGTAGLLEKQIRALTGPQASIVPDTFGVRRIVREDTVAVALSKRPFFRRLADLFSPPKADSNVVISRREVVGVIPKSMVQDTITLVLQALQDSVTSERLQIYDRAWQEGLRLRYSNERVNSTIYRLIRDFEAEDTDYLVGLIRQREEMQIRSSRVLGAIAGAAVLLMLLFVAVLWRDINRSNRYRRALEQANRDNEALLAAREKLMLAITHDIKAPLGSVMGYIDLLERLTTDKRAANYLRNMQESSEHLLALVNSLLDFHRLDINKIEIHEVPFSPAQLFETIRAGFAAAADAKGLELRLVVEPAARRRVRGDAFRIRQIAENLISNALKFTDKGSVTIHVDLLNDRLVFYVRDTGRGIGAKEKERIFGEFVRLSSAQGVEGFGLGLSIVDRLVKLLRGAISLESRPGAGSRFIVSLPVGRADEGETPPLGEETSGPLWGLYVLLVDDDPLQLEMTAAMCRREGAEAECCPHPEFAAKVVGERKFDAVLTDIQMPAMDGFGVLAAIREVDPEVPVIAVSARAELRDEPAAGGFAACLCKPFSASELAAAVATACGRKTAAVPAGAREPNGAGEPDGSGVDFGALTAFAGDDTAAARNILVSFARQSAADCDALEKALDARDAAALRALAHKMLPLFSMLRANDVARTLRQAENVPGWDEVRVGELRRAVEIIRALAAEAQKKVTL